MLLIIRRTPTIACLLLVSWSTFAQARFKPAEFKGIILGKSKYEELTALLGEPSTTFVDRSGLAWLYFDSGGPVAGKIEVIADANTKVMQTLILYPDSLREERLEAVFGSGFIKMRYDFDMCLADGGDAPIFLDPEGPLEFLVNQELGIAITVERERIQSVEYLSEPLGPDQSQCTAQI